MEADRPDLETNRFKNVLETNDLGAMKQIPKADVHNHGVLGMRLSTFNRKFGTQVAPPAGKLAGLQGFDEYVFRNLAPAIQTAEQLKILLEETIIEAINDGVALLEASVDISWLHFFGSPSDCTAAIARIRDNYRHKIDFRPELGIPKTIDMKQMEAVLAQCIDSGIFKSVDLYGDESIVDFDRFRSHYRYAREKGLKLKAHAGEFSGPEIVRKAIETLELDEIQHGIGIVGNDLLIDEIKERGIRLNICPGSNVALGAVPDITAHPIAALFEKGVRLSINTDDILVFNRSVSEEYFDLYHNHVLSADQLDEIRKIPLNFGEQVE